MEQNSNQVTLSYELLHLIQWLIEKEPEKFKLFLQELFTNGFEEELQKAKAENTFHSASDLSYGIVDFLSLMEILLEEIADEKRLESVIHKKLMPAIDHIDGHECDDSTVKTSVDKATTAFEEDPKHNPQELLFKELLRSWKPTKDTVTH